MSDTTSSDKERPILFQGAMVRALLAGTKTQTRRAVKGIALDWLGPEGFTPEFVASPENHLCPYGFAGDRLYVRESFSGLHDYDAGHDGKPWPPSAWFPTDPIWYWADGNPTHGDWTKPRPGIHMPRWACRIVLEITDVRVERLQDISEADARAEGIVAGYDGWHTEGGQHFHASDPRESYFSLWESINGAGSVEANPFVWAVSFRSAAAALAVQPNTKE